MKRADKHYWIIKGRRYYMPKRLFDHIVGLGVEKHKLEMKLLAIKNTIKEK